MLEFRILGPLEVWDGEKALDLGGNRQRAVLALLAIHVGEVVPSERLITYLWGESPPPTAATSLQNAISQLRKSLGADAVETRAPGYALGREKRRRRASVRGAPDRGATAEPDRRIRLVREALELWRGPPLADFAYEPFAQNEAGRLEELRLTRRRGSDRGGARARRRRRSSSGSWKPWCARTRFASARAASYMLALYRSGRQAEALQAYQETRRMLVEELGIEPTPALQQLHASILRQESALQPQAVPGAARTGSARSPGRSSRGRLVPVLGPGPSSGDGQAVASRLAEAFDCPEEHRGDLTRVSQYVAVTQGVGPLYDELHDLFAESPRARAGRALPREPPGARAGT